MIKEFQIQLDKAEPLTFEEYQQLEETTFHVGEGKYIPNLKYKFYFSGREKQIGDIVLLAVLSTFFKDENGREQIELQTITLHPDEINNFQLSEIQPTVNETLFPVIVYRSKEEIKKEKEKIDIILNKVIIQGFKSLNQEERDILNKNNQN